MAVNQTRGNKLLREEVAYLKSLFNRFRNDREVNEIFYQETGKVITNGMVNHIRRGYRWDDVQPSTEKPWK